MANKQTRKGRSNLKYFDFIGLERYIINSFAYWTLKPVQRAALIELMYAYNGSNNGWIRMGVRELADRLNVKKSTAHRALTVLEELKFVEVVQKGSFKLKDRRAAEYKLAMYPCDISGHAASKGFMQLIGTRSQQRDRTVPTEARTKREKPQQSRERDCQPQVRPTNGPASGTLLYSTKEGAVQMPTTTAKIIPFPVPDEMPDLPAFLDRRGIDVG